MKISDSISLITLCLGASSFVGGLIMWWTSTIRKRYAIERDFAHIRRNQEQGNQLLVSIDKDLGDKTDHIIQSLSLKLDINQQHLTEIKALLLTRLGERMYSSKRDQDI